jgi:ribonucleotide monophosphatase NagD (HAD superfamily)
MKHSKYNYRSENLFLLYEFLSEGPKGLIKKMVEYSETATENVYNLGFGDFEEKTGEINDLSVTNNGDSLKVLATVASTVYAFTEKYPKAWILATGSTAVRTRLYRMGITNNLEEIKEDFIVLGYTKDEQWEEFVIGEDYEAFLLTKKENEFFI